MVTKKITISGNVQGVNFRNEAKKKADSLLIKGEIRNLANGNVQIMATADETILFQLIDWCYQGPPRAEVDHVEVEDVTLDWFDDFRIVR